MESSDPKYKHKPSEKHTLEEVLKSLQDLIRVDLSEDGSAKGKSEPPGTSRPVRDTAPPAGIRDKHPGQREDFAPASPASGPVNLDAVMRSLKDLIGNELNVGDEPRPETAQKAPTHEEYLSSGEEIEEYFPEELSALDDNPDLSGEAATPASEPGSSIETMSTPEAAQEALLSEESISLDEELTIEEPAPRDSLELPGEKPPFEDVSGEEIVAASIPEEFTPIDEELTFEQPPEPAPPPTTPPEEAELPGEISPELLEEAEAAVPILPTPPPTAEEATEPGTQHEMFFGETVTPPGPDFESLQESPESAPDALPTIDVEESFDNGEYFAAAAPPDETPPPDSEETIALDAELPADPDFLAPPPDESSPREMTAMAGISDEKITLEVESETGPEHPRDEYSVDFEPSGLAPPLPGEPELAPPEASPPAGAETPAVNDVPDVNPLAETPITRDPGPGARETPLLETREEVVPDTTPPPESTEAPAPDKPAAFTLDDFPVLSEVVAPLADGTHEDKSGATPAGAPLPAPDRAREIVVRAVAKLNVEMRKSGGAGLDTRTILRLQQLIRRELEKGGEK